MKKHSITIAGHRTSVTLENRFWDFLKEIATKKNCSLRALIETVDTERGAYSNLSSALRLYVLNYLEKKD